MAYTYVPFGDVKYVTRKAANAAATQYASTTGATIKAVKKGKHWLLYQTKMVTTGKTPLAATKLAGRGAKAVGRGAVREIRTAGMGKAPIRADSLQAYKNVGGYATEPLAREAAAGYKAEGHQTRVTRVGGKGVVPSWQLSRTMTTSERKRASSKERFARRTRLSKKAGTRIKQLTSSGVGTTIRAGQKAGETGEKAGEALSGSMFRRVATQEMADSPASFRWRRKGNIGSKLPDRRAPLGQMPSGKMPISE